MNFTSNRNNYRLLGILIGLLSTQAHADFSQINCFSEKHAFVVNHGAAVSSNPLSGRASFITAYSLNLSLRIRSPKDGADKYVLESMNTIELTPYSEAGLQFAGADGLRFDLASFSDETQDNVTGILTLYVYQGETLRDELFSCSVIPLLTEGMAPITPRPTIPAPSGPPARPTAP